jgi:hypothetical protein
VVALSVTHTIKYQQIKRLQATRHGLAEEFRAHGIKPARDLDFFASELPDEEALYGLWRHIQELAVQRIGSATAACDALDDVIIARENYDLEARRQPSRQARLARDLTAFARKPTTCEIIALLEGRVADPQRGPPVLVALWKGGVAAGLARDTDKEGKPDLSVKIAGKWTSVQGDAEEGLGCLAEDPVVFAVAARKALALEKRKSPPPDRLRSLRALIAKPTRRRFEALLEEVADEGGSRVEIYLPALRQATGRYAGWPSGTGPPADEALTLTPSTRGVSIARRSGAHCLV